MSLKPKDITPTSERMATTPTALPSKHDLVQTVTPMDTSSTKSDNTNSTPAPCNRERRRREHNDMEKKRKEQIKACICTMGVLLPTYNSAERQSTLEIVEKSLNYMREMKEAQTKFTGIEEGLQTELSSLTKERDKLLDIIKAAGLSSESLPYNGVSSTTDMKGDSPKPKLKTKKRNTLSSQVQQQNEQKERERIAQQEMISSSVPMSEDLMTNIAANPNQMMSMPGGASFMSGNQSNMMYNPMMMPGTGPQPFMMQPGMMTPGNQIIPNIGMTMPGGGAMIQNSNVTPPTLGPNGPMSGSGNSNSQNDGYTNNNLNKSTDSSDAAGLLQLAMQDAGITPGSTSQANSAAVTPSYTEASNTSESESLTSKNNPLQTLATVATSAHGGFMENSENQSSSNLTGSTQVTAQNSNVSAPVTSAQAGFPPIIQNGPNSFVNMPMIGNQAILPGQQQQQQPQQTQQVMFINEQGIPMIANLPIPDPTGLQKQGMVQNLNQQMLIKNESGNIEQNSMNNAIALQQQANMAALQNQLLGQGGGPNIQNMAAFQQQNLMNGNIIQTQNGQFLQQIGPQSQMQTTLQGQPGQIINVPGQGQVMVGGQQGPMPVSQNGNFLTLNTMPSQPNQLPSALILPNGQIIPVVTNANNVVTQAGGTLSQGQMPPQTRMPGAQLQTQVSAGLDGQMLSGTQQGSQGLLMTAGSGPTAVMTSASATLSTSVVPTSAIHSVMTTQLQGSVLQSGKLISSSGPGSQTDVSVAVSGQPKVVSLPPGSGSLQPGGKSSATPILISLPINGQPTTVLLDPVTMQVLGTVQPQPASSGSGSASSGTSTGAISTSISIGNQSNSTSAAQSTGNSSSAANSAAGGKNSKNKNNANQRAICPKPLGNADGIPMHKSSSKKKRPKAKSKEVVLSHQLADSLQIQIPESTTDPETASAISSESTDILAKAAESIFSSPLGEVSNVGFYNPANEDNPLHIDTSATEGEEDPSGKMSAAKKMAGNPKRVAVTLTSVNGQTLEDNVFGINSVANESNKMVTLTANTNSSKIVTSAANVAMETSTADNVNSLSATLEEIAGIRFGDSDVSMDITPEKTNDLMDIVMDTKSSKKSKSSAKSNESKKESSSKSVKSGSTKICSAQSKGNSNKKQATDKNNLVEMSKNNEVSQMDIESTLIHIPEEITFSENDLSDVLDQVEHMGSSPIENTHKMTPSAKKSKSKRSKMADSDNEPSAKKRKNGKDGNSSKNVGQPKDIPLSMPTSLSVYDFDDSDDFVPTILPLNGKDFSSTLTTTASSMPTKSELGIIDKEKTGKTSKPSVQSNKPSSKSSNSKTMKNVKVPNSKENDLNAQKSMSGDLTPSGTLFNLSEVDKKNEKNKEKQDLPKPFDLMSSASLPNMPDIDTTTSLFGFPVPKKLQRVDVSARLNSQASPKTSVQTTPKQTSQTNAIPKTSMVSPKQSMISPMYNIVSPKQSVFSPEMISPRLSIVSPLMSDGDSPSLTPKQYTEMSPVKKHSPTDKTDNLKVSSFSALNSVPLSSTVSESGVTVTVGPKDIFSNQSTMPATTQSAGVITSAKAPVSSANINTKSNNLSNENNSHTKDFNTGNDKRKQENTKNTPFNTKIGAEDNNPPVSLPNNMSSNMAANKSSTNSRNFSNPNMDVNFNNQPNPSLPFKNSSNSSQRSSSTIHSSQNSQNNKHCANQPFNNNPVYTSMPNMNKNMPKDNNNLITNSMSSMNNFNAPYSAESLFNQPEKVIKSPPNVNISTNPSILNQQKNESTNLSKARSSNAYSVDSFVQSSRDDGMGMRNSGGLVAQSDLIGASDFPRLARENSPDGFNFANIGLNLTPITTTAANSNFMDLSLPNSSVITSNSSSSSFSFSLSSTSSTVTTTSSGGLGHHQFPFYPVLSSASSNVPPAEAGLSSVPNMGMFGSNNVIQRNNTVMHPSGSNSNMPRADNSHISRMEPSNISRGDNQHGMPRDGSQQIIPDDVNRDQNSSRKPACSKQPKTSKGPSGASMQEPFPYTNSSSAAHEQNFFHDSQMKSNIGKSAPEQMRKPQDKLMDMNQTQSRSSNQSSHQDKRGGNIDRSPQMMNSGQYFPPHNFPSSKSLNTPPLHHPSSLMPDERLRNMTNRSPYDSLYPPPPSSQGFLPMNHGFPPNNRFDSNNSSYSRDSSGTQPLSHTPINTGGRKSANPPNQQTSVVKAPPKQSAPPLVPMAPQQQQPSQSLRPTPPQASHRATTPLANAPQPIPTPSGVSHSRNSKQPSRNSSKQSSKSKAKQLPFMEVDSNLSNSIFETNRSMTPFFPMQNLSPQSRAMQHEGSPFLPGNFFAPGGPRFPNSNTPMPKNSDIGGHFNPLFTPRGPQNGLGLNFQPGFPVNMNPLHGNHSNGPQITPHSAPHMANFNLNNIFSDVNNASQNESSLNISPIKFPHANSMLQHQGMDPNAAMQHHHQYNRGHPSVMSINSILGPNHHGFDGRMNTSMAGPFHSHGHPSFIPPLNFSMHDH